MIFINILIIDDEPIVRKGLSYILNKTEINDSRLKVFEADGSLHADQLMVEREFDIVFTDIKMPGMDGLTFIDERRDKMQNTQWVILSGYDDFNFAQKAISLGVKEYLLKPITKKRAQETLMRLVSYHQKRSNNFISLNELGEILTELEEAIWIMDEQLLSSSLSCWSEKMIKKEIEVNYYLNTLNNLLTNIILRINKRGSIQLEEQQVLIKGNNIEEISNNFLDSCLELIEIIRLQRKGQILDPIEYAKEYITENLENKITLDDVANKIGLNAAYFSHLFKKETGTSFIEFRLQLRMEKAKKLIESGTMKITEIAHRLGYEDLSHFTKTFKKYTGFSPSKYIARLGID